MVKAQRPMRAFFYWLMLAAAVAHATPPALTTITDVIYRGNGTPASGTLLVSWPAFITADHKPVTAGSLSVTVGPNGAVSLALAPNAGASPAGTFYRIVLKLDDGSSNVEYWTVPTTSPATLEAIRSNVVPASVAMQVASRQYVDSALSAKASDSSVVHLAGGEVIAGSKQFTSPPTAPAPVGTSDLANKLYVDNVVSVSGGTTFVRKIGDSMTGPLTLSGDPSADNHAANRHYVDTQTTTLSGQLATRAQLNAINTFTQQQVFRGPATGLTGLSGETDLGGSSLPFPKIVAQYSTITQSDTGSNFYGIYSRLDTSGGGVYTPGPKTGYKAFEARQEISGPAAVSVYGMNVRGYARAMDTCILCGDSLSFAGLPDTGGNIQFELMSGDIPQVWRAVVAGSPAANATLIGFSGASNSSPVGARRLVVNTTHALKTAGTVAAISPNGKTPGLRTADTVTFSGAGLVASDAGRCFKLNLDDNTLDGSTLGAWYRMASVNVGAQTATLEGSFGGDRTGFGLSLRSLYRVSNVVTVSTTEEHHLTSGQSISISGSAGFADGTFTITVTDPVHFTFAQVGADDHAFTGTVQTAAAPTYTIADCSEAVAYDGVNHRLTIQANSYAWANGDTLQSGPNAYGGGGVGAFAIQKFTPHTAFAGTGMNVQVRGVQDADYAYGITADGSFRPNIRFGIGYLANYSHIGFNCEQADISCLDSSVDVPLFRVGRGDAGGSWSARLASSLMGGGSGYVFRFNGQDRVGISQDGSYTLFPGLSAAASGPSIGLNGTGVPEGGVTASMGSVYLRTFDGTAYIKSTATGNTGWKKFVAGPGISDSSTSVRLTLSDSSSALGSAGHVFINPAAGNNIVRIADGTYQIDFLNGSEQILFNSARDTGIRRLSAGKMGIGNGTIGNAAGEHQ